jgi:LacI family gluconate utilization system Gnt-I transcriptional repressor
MTDKDTPARRTRRKNGGLTLTDVARLAGVSPITASRALNTPGAVSDVLLARVRAAVESTGYVPNMLAGGLASRKSRLVAAVVPTISGSVFLDMVQSLTATLADQGYQLMLGQSGYVDSREDELLEAIIGRRPDGVVLTGTMRSSQGRRRLQAAGLPVVETWDLGPEPIDMLVGFSHEAIGEAVAKFLHQRGRQRVATLSANDERAMRRNRAFSDTAVQLGMAAPGAARILDHLVTAPSTVRSGREGLRSLLARDPAIDALFCSSDMMALGVLTEAQAMGLRIPEQLAVVGVGDHGFSKDLEPALTTVRVDGELIGQLAANFIVARTEERPIDQLIVDVGFTIIERQST